MNSLRSMTQSRSGRLICPAVLLLFVLVCGIHIAGVHHDEDGHVLAIGVTLLVGFVVMAILVEGFVAKTVPVPAAMIVAARATDPAGPLQSLPVGWRLPLLH